MRIDGSICYVLDWNVSKEEEKVAGKLGRALTVLCRRKRRPASDILVSCCSSVESFDVVRIVQ